MTHHAHALRTDLSLRAGGMLSFAIAAVAIQTLTRLPSPAGAVAVLLAAIGFLGASAGAMLLLLGRHIHDRVTVSVRWQRVARPAGR